jgi:hypothetical protein
MEDLPAIPLYSKTVHVVAREDVAFKVSPGQVIQAVELSGRAKN